MKRILVTISALIVLVGCSDNASEDIPEETNLDKNENVVEVEVNENEQEIEETSQEEPVEEEETEIEIYNEISTMMANTDGNSESVEGTGNQSQVFDVLIDGMVKFSSSYEGDSNFMVHIEDGTTGDRVGSAANHIGNYNGEQYIYLEQGEYILQVKSSGNWAIEIEQPFLNGVIEDKEFNGIGSYTIGPLTFNSDRIELLANHDGDSNFMVHILGVYGDRTASAFNEIGIYEGNHITVVNPSLIYYIDITADGNWNLEIKD